MLYIVVFFSRMFVTYTFVICSIKLLTYLSYRFRDKRQFRSKIAKFILWVIDDLDAPWCGYDFGAERSRDVTTERITDKNLQVAFDPCRFQSCQ